MKFAILSSGSKANGTYFESGGIRILIDCGLSARETERRLVGLGVQPGSISAILVTHEHSDHIYGIPVFSRKYKIPVFANVATSEMVGPVHGIEHFATGEPFSVGGLQINPFRIAHDAVDPVGFTIRSEGLKFTQVTDLGKVTPLVCDAVAGAHAVVLEANHDPEMLMSCGYPWVLKQRIRSSHGHLSNPEAAQLLFDLLHADLLHVVLGHLSENSNTPELARAAVHCLFPDGPPFSLTAACRHSATPLFEVGEPARAVA